MTITKVTFGKIALILGVIFYLTACELPTKTEQQTYNLFEGLETVEGAEEVKLTINQGSAVGRDAYFEFEVDNINSSLLKPGVYEGWCIDWTKPIAQQGDTHEGLQMYSTFGKDKWKPLNYFLNIKDELKEKDRELTFTEFQAVIWSVQEGPDFNVNSLSDEELPPRLLKDGKANFSREKVNAIVADIRQNAASFEYGADTQYALFLKTADDDQDVMVPADPPGDGENVTVEIEDLGNIDGRGLNEAVAINNEGEITGTSDPHPRQEDGNIFLWEEGSGMQAIPQLPNDGMFPRYWSIDINNSTQIIGHAHLQSGEQLSLLWDPVDGVESLGGIDVRGINDNATIIVAGDFDEENSAGYTMDASGNKDTLETLSEYYGSPDDSDYNTPIDINNNGIVLGTANHPDFGPTPVLWQNGQIIKVFDDFDGLFTAINDNDQLAGTVEISGEIHGVLWDEPNGYTYIDPVDGYTLSVNDLNNLGHIVGTLTEITDPGSPYGTKAFYWDEDREMILLEPLGDYEVGEANAINDNNVIAGRSSDNAGSYNAVRWVVRFES